MMRRGCVVGVDETVMKSCHDRFLPSQYALSMVRSFRHHDRSSPPQFLSMSGRKFHVDIVDRNEESTARLFDKTVVPEEQSATRAQDLGTYPSHRPIKQQS
jgi:hypothetical protein